MQQSIKTGYFFLPTKFGIMKSREIGAHISKVKKKKKQIIDMKEYFTERISESILRNGLENCFF